LSLEIFMLYLHARPFWRNFFVAICEPNAFT
jgi:hypothetical protein